MDAYTLAIEYDVREQFVEAADKYEEAVKTSASIDAYINLACLYWQATDFGLNSALRLPLGFVGKAGERVFTVLDGAEGRFGYHPEVMFWRMYIRWTDLDGSPFPDEALELAQQENASLVPYFHVYNQTRNEAYLPHVQALVEQAHKLPTAKNRYILSMLGDLLE